ncbi:MAG: Uma2 family endonuclease [Planctomycetaceae bacterium]|nr:Uma2 family endonuclease [Planctomycetaceae bacterium]
MATSLQSRRMTVKELLDLERQATDDIHRELFRGQLQEFPEMTTRSPRHSASISKFSQQLLNWAEANKRPDAIVCAGEVRCRMSTDAESIVGVDVAYFEGTSFREDLEDQAYFDGPPVIAVEVLSPSNTHEQISQRIKEFLVAGVRQVWIADPDFQTVAVYKANVRPTMYSHGEHLIGAPDLPGFECPVEKLFGGTQEM